MRIHPNLNVNYHYKSHHIDKHGNKTPLNESSFPDRFEYMKHKYKDVFLPVRVHSPQQLAETNAMIEKKYPFHLSDDEKCLFYMDFRKPINIYKDPQKAKAEDERITAQIVKAKAKVQMYKNLDKKTYQEYKAYLAEVSKTRPLKNEHYALSHSQEALNLYNASVYEGLEQGYDLQTAKGLANQAVITYMPHIKHNDNNEALKSSHNLFPEWQIDEENPEVLTDPIAHKYNPKSSFIIQQNDAFMANAILSQIQTFSFLLNHPGVYAQEAKKDERIAPGEQTQEFINSYKKMHTNDLAVARVAQKAFEQYGIYNQRLNIST